MASRIRRLLRPLSVLGSSFAFSKSPIYSQSPVPPPRNNILPEYTHSINRMAALREITENEHETEFAQREAIINYGSAPISTYNLVNCIAIGGTFRLPDGKIGSFLTHEGPNDYIKHKSKLSIINDILKGRGAIIEKIVLFHIDKPSTTVYLNGLTTAKIIELMHNYSYKLFGIEPTLKDYTCDSASFRCGKAIISPSSYNTSLIQMKSKDYHKSNAFATTNNSAGPAGGAPAAAAAATFNAEWADNRFIQCPICKYKQNVDYIDRNLHAFGCPNKGKMPNIDWASRPASGGRRRTRRSRKRLSRRRNTRR